MQKNLQKIKENGGNSIRIWLHTTGEGPTPYWGNDGYVFGTDKRGSLVDELKSFLDYAQSQNVFVIISLWDGANSAITQRAINLMWDESKLQSYIDNCLVPMATALKTHPALLAWEIFNEAEGLVRNEESNREKCFDTTALKNSGAGWAGKYVPMKNLLAFINRQADAIKGIRGNEILVTTSSWNEKAVQDVYGFNYYTDSCLTKAGGKTRGTVDFHQVHTYSGCQCGSGNWKDSQPMSRQKSDYRLSKPLIVGEFSSACSAGDSVQSMYKHFYEAKYDGAFGWQLYDEGKGHCSDGKTKTLSGINSLKGRTDQGQISVNI